MKKLIFLISFVLIPSFGFADSKNDQAVIAKKDFQDQFIPAFTNILCKKGQYFRDCFKVTSQECLSELTSAAEACFAKMQNEIPSKLKQPEDGRIWGSKLGACAGGTYENTLKIAKKQIDSADCKNPEKWKN